jgi:alkylation response protein AidB-like acyl-CoA dehydrogenase
MILCMASLTPAEAVARAKALAPVLRERSRETNLARRVPPETIRDFTSSGLLRLLQPVRYGGLELDLETFANTVFEVCRGCGSAGWVYSVLSNHQWMLGMFDDAAQRDVWGDNPDAVAAASFMPTGKVTRETGGYRLGGKWGFCSGCDNAQWIMLMGITGMAAPVGEAPPHPIFKMFLVPMRECEIEDNWHVVGLRGTGSKNVIARDVFVPDHRVLDFVELREGDTPGGRVNTGPLYNLQAMANFALCLAAPAVGIAWGAYDRFVEQAKERSVRGGRLGMAALPTIQMRVSEAAAMIDSAGLLLLRDAKAAYETARAGAKLDMAGRALNRRNHAWAATLACQATEKLLRACGGAGLFEGEEIQQCYRDVFAVSSHIGTNWDSNSSFFGKITLGVPVQELIY